ncbi:MAG: ROK family protein, partial [Abditibacteriota bacterium]|nr:ROK family protein [Abditibacteriota bacterium]
LCVPVGTGCGSVFLVDGAPAENGFPGVPENGYIYPAPFLDGCIDDHISKRGLMGLSRQILGRPLEGRELAEAAFRGDPGARRVWNIFGERLRDALSGYLMPGGFAPSVLCLGGGVMKSAPLFIGPLERLCDSLGIRLTVETDTPQMILKGLTRI